MTERPLDFPSILEGVSRTISKFLSSVSKPVSVDRERSDKHGTSIRSADYPTQWHPPTLTKVSLTASRLTVVTGHGCPEHHLRKFQSTRFFRVASSKVSVFWRSPFLNPRAL